MYGNFFNYVYRYMIIIVFWDMKYLYKYILGRVVLLRKYINISL